MKLPKLKVTFPFGWVHPFRKYAVKAVGSPRRITLYFGDTVDLGRRPISEMVQKTLDEYYAKPRKMFWGKLKHYLVIAGMALFLWFMAFALPLGFLI